MRNRIVNILLAIVATAVLAVPAAIILTGNVPEPTQSEINRNLKFDIQKKDSQIEQIQTEKTEVEKKADELKKQNEQLQKDLQAKRDRQANEAKLAAANKPAAVSSGTSCRDAIAQTWPAELQSGAIIVMTNENRSENPAAVGAINPDSVGSQDFGCFQINNYWHKDFFANNDWRDPVANARYAYQIYKGRGNWTAWYAVQGILW